MVQNMSIALSVGLVILGLVELNRAVALWIPWVTFTLAVCAFLVGVAADKRSPRSVRVGGPMGLSLGLLALWLVLLSVGSPSWLVWWNFVFAVAFLLVGMGAEPTRGAGKRRAQRTGYEPWETTGLSLPYWWNYGWGPYGTIPWSYGKPSKHFRRGDQRIQEDIYERLAYHGNLDASDVEITVKDGEVTLVGEVETRKDKRTVEEIADSALGVREVHNNLGIRQGGAAADRAA